MYILTQKKMLRKREEDEELQPNKKTKATVEKLVDTLEKLTMFKRQELYKTKGYVIDLDFLIRDADIPSIILARILLFLSPEEVAELRLVSKELKRVIDEYKILQILDNSGAVWLITNVDFQETISSSKQGIVSKVTISGNEYAFITTNGVIEASFVDIPDDYSVKGYDISIFCIYTTRNFTHLVVKIRGDIHIFRNDDTSYILSRGILGYPKKAIPRSNGLFVLTEDGLIFLFKERKTPYIRVLLGKYTGLVKDFALVDKSTLLLLIAHNGGNFLRLRREEGNQIIWNMIETEIPPVKVFSNGKYVAYLDNNRGLFMGIYNELRHTVVFTRILNVPPIANVVFSGPKNTSTVIALSVSGEVFTNGFYIDDEEGKWLFFPPTTDKPYDKNYMFEFEIADGINESLGRILDIDANEGGDVYVIADSTKLENLPDIKSQVAECHVELCEKLTLTKCNQCNSTICSKCFVNHQIKC